MTVMRNFHSRRRHLDKRIRKRDLIVNGFNRLTGICDGSTATVIATNAILRCVGTISNDSKENVMWIE